MGGADVFICSRWGGKEVLEGSDVDKDGKEATGWRQWGRGSDCGNGGFNNGWRNVLNWDVFNGTWSMMSPVS